MDYFWGSMSGPQRTDLEWEKTAVFTVDLPCDTIISSVVYGSWLSGCYSLLGVPRRPGSAIQSVLSAIHLTDRGFGWLHLKVI